MIIYYALTNCKQFTETLYECKAENWLFSYFYVKDKDIIEHPKVKFFIDSGAFSAKSQNKQINLTEYIKFIKRHQDKIIIYAGLDVIGSSKDTEENIRIMKSEGLNPIPTMHRMGDYDYLIKMIEEYDYIALGGMGTESGSAIATTQRLKYLDRCWNEINKRKPDLKVHGFGCTSPVVMSKYPWHSVDSTAWISGGKFGRVFTPWGQLNFGHDASDPNHWQRISTHDLPQYIDYFKSINCNFDLMKHDYKQRNKANVKFFQTLEKKKEERNVHGYAYQAELF